MTLRSIVALLPALLLPGACATDGAGADGGAGLDAGASKEPIARLAGEVHLHQFPMGSHAWSGFLVEPVARESVTTDQLVDLAPEPARRDGACSLYLQPTCAPACAVATEYCAATNTCRPIPRVAFMDNGEVRVTGSRLWPVIRMWYEPMTRTYLSEPPPGRALLYEGGERLRVEGGRGDLAFAGTVKAPLLPSVTRPDLAAPLRLPRAGGPLDVEWRAEGAQYVVVIVNVSSRSDRSYGFIRCVTADLGSARVPADMVAALPPPPRDVRLEVERVEEEVMPTGRAGVGVIVRAHQSMWKNDVEP